MTWMYDALMDATINGEMLDFMRLSTIAPSPALAETSSCICLPVAS